MVNWVLTIAVIVLIFILFKTKEVKHKVGTFIVLGFILFFIFTFSQVASRPEVNFNTFDGIVNMARVYFSWLGQVFSNLVEVTGSAVNLDWTKNLSEVNLTR